MPFIDKRIQEEMAEKMIEEYPRKSGKRIYVLLFLLILLGLLVIVFVSNTATEPESVFAVEGQEADSNQSATEPNQPPEKKPEDPNEKKLLRPLHKHPSFAERVEERSRMVRLQIESRAVKDPNVLRAMRVVPRHVFVRSREQRYAYADHPLPIGYDQTISQPYIVAFMTEAMKLDPNSVVLEIGTGSGYQAAVCAEIAQQVYTIEIVEELAKIAKERLKELGYRNVFTKAGDGFFGWPEHAPFDAIIGTAAAGRIPKPLIEQLKPGGRMILPYGSPRGFQYLVLLTKDKDGNVWKRNVMPVRFVPMTGEVQKTEEESQK